MMAPFNQEQPPMNKPFSPAAGSTLRQRFVEDMTVRGFTEKTRRYYIRIGPSQKSSKTRARSEIPITTRLLTAGSFFGDFRTPSGVRNSSRKRNGRFGRLECRSGH
jgi:hypothetical protein